MADTIKTPRFRVSFPNLFTARAAPGGGEPKYSLSMLFPPGTDLSELKKAAAAVVTEKFGPDASKYPAKLKTPFIDQGGYDYEGYEKGAILIRATSKQKPGLVDKNVKPIIDESEVYPGCYAIATVRPFYYDSNGNKGVSFGLQNVQIVADGEPIGGRARPEKEFEPVHDDVAGNSGDSAQAGSASSLFG